MSVGEKAAVFCAAVDSILSGDKVPHTTVLSDEMADLLVLAECLATTRYEPSETIFQHQLETSILQHVEQRRSEKKWAGATQSLVAAMRLQFRAALVGSLLILVAGVVLLSLNPTARAQVDDILRWTTVHEIDTLPHTFHLDGESPHTKLPSPVPLFIAKARASFPIKRPDYLPMGLRFDGTIILEIHDFADGPSILLCYSSSMGGFVIEEFKPLYSVREAVATDSSDQIEVNGQQALYVDGRWQVEEDGTYTGWISGDSDRLLYEIDDIAVWIHASPPLGHEELVRIAESLR